MSEREHEDGVFLTIAAHYLLSNCDDCPFYEVVGTCDSKPINCKWMVLHYCFKDGE